MTACLLFAVLLPALPASSAEDPTPDANAKTLVWSDGTRYVGGVEDGKRSGKGTIFWQDGTRFVGSFSEDMRNGPGTMIMPDGTVYNGYFRNDKLVEAPVESGSPEPAVDVAALQTAPTPAVVAEPVAPVVVTPAVIAPAAIVAEQPPVVATVETSPAPVQTGVDPTVTLMSDSVKDELLGTVTAWATAWEERNVAAYLAHYSGDFTVPDNLSRTNWENLRRTRITRPKSIEIDIRFDKFEIVARNEAEVSFLQTYKSDVFSDQTSKVLKLRKEDTTWRILEEKLGSE